jgi:excisionase family DNA binding protein
MSTLPQLTRDDVLDGRQVAELLHLPSSTVLEYARRGVIPAHKLGRRWVFIRDELATALRAAPQTEPRRSPPRARPPRDVKPGAQLPLPFDSAA